MGMALPRFWHVSEVGMRLVTPENAGVAIAHLGFTGRILKTKRRPALSRI
jgi:hypothetical protein